MRIIPKQIIDNKNKYNIFFSNQKPKYKTYKYFKIKPYKSMKITKTNKNINQAENNNIIKRINKNRIIPEYRKGKKNIF